MKKEKKLFSISRYIPYVGTIIALIAIIVFGIGSKTELIDQILILFLFKAVCPLFNGHHRNIKDLITTILYTFFGVVFIVLKLCPINLDSVCVWFGVISVIINAFIGVLSFIEAKKDKWEIADIILSIIEIVFSILLIIELHAGLLIHFIVILVSTSILFVEDIVKSILIKKCD